MKNYKIQIVYFRTGMIGVEVGIFTERGVKEIEVALCFAIDRLKMDLEKRNFELLGIESVSITQI